MNSNHCQLFTILIGFRTASPNTFPPCNKSVVIDGPTLKNYAKKANTKP